ncbi:hypothetical protein QMG61_09855, partial [Cryobacterium sp. PH31-AA6]|uniref:hypothetical protein n=1 Tax=Cryobacterium sp. PH31-AA6 TaxID=3046205 RepID=UPI0024BA3FA7
ERDKTMSGPDRPTHRDKDSRSVRQALSQTTLTPPTIITDKLDHRTSSITGQARSPDKLDPRLYLNNC